MSLETTGFAVEAGLVPIGAVTLFATATHTNSGTMGTDNRVQGATLHRLPSLIAMDSCPIAVKFPSMALTICIN